MLEAIHIENTLTSSVGGVSTSIGMDLAARSASEHDYNLTFASRPRGVLSRDLDAARHDLDESFTALDLRCDRSEQINDRR